MAAKNARAAPRTTDGYSPAHLSHSSPSGHEVEDDMMERRLTRSEEVSSFVKAEARKPLSPAPVRSPVRKYGSINHQEYGMDHVALWNTDGNAVGSQSGRRSGRLFSNTFDEEFSIVSEELLRSEEATEVRRGWGV